MRATCPTLLILSYPTQLRNSTKGALICNPQGVCRNISPCLFDSRRGLGIFLFTTASRMALGPTQPPIQWVPGALSVGVKRPVREADHSHPSRAEVKECVGLYLRSPNTTSWRGAQLNHRDNFTFNFTIYIKVTEVSSRLDHRA
jgi:hypothetical protein